MYLKPPTPEQLAAVFNQLLTEISAGQLAGCPTDTGLDGATIAALNQINGAIDKKTAIDHARRVFATPASTPTTTPQTTTNGQAANRP